MCLDSKEVIWPLCYNFYLLFGCRTAYGVIIHLINGIDATSLPTRRAFVWEQAASVTCADRLRGGSSVGALISISAFSKKGELFVCLFYHLE